jgi:hypothetical protein
VCRLGSRDFFLVGRLRSLHFLFSLWKFDGPDSGTKTNELTPPQVLRCLSEWVSVLEERGTVPGTSLGSILAGIQQFEISLTSAFFCSVHLICFLFLRFCCGYSLTFDLSL